MSNSAFVFSDQLLNYKFNASHPFNPLRLEMTIDLLKEIKAVNEASFIMPDKADDHLLSLFHDETYIDAVKKASQGLLSKEAAEPFGLGTEDTPIFEGMHEASAMIASATVKAADLVASGSYQHAINLGGGLHHGFRNKASGFCIYNDIAIAIKYLQEKHHMKVLYIDTDAHHGDGVQWGFYDDPSVSTFSIHETGRYLFPGTGYVHERGAGSGHGFTFNLPVDAFTEDDSWLNVFEKATKEITEFFKPDIIFSQHGVDSHYYDPLTHLNLTMNSYHKIPKIIHQLSHDYCNGKWIAVGGGGYDIWRVVPRAWSLVWLEMIEQDLPKEELPQSFIDKWSKRANVKIPKTWSDPDGIYPAIPRKQEITDVNEQTLQKLIHAIQLRTKFL